MQEQAKAMEKQLVMERLITRILLVLGVPARLNGYRYLRDGIHLVVERPEEVTAVTKHLYPMIAEKYHVSSASVERAIRHAIEVSWNRGNVDEFDRMFGYTIDTAKGKPTNSEYIALIADHIRLGYEI